MRSALYPLQAFLGTKNIACYSAHTLSNHAVIEKENQFLRTNILRMTRHESYMTCTLIFIRRGHDRVAYMRVKVRQGESSMAGISHEWAAQIQTSGLHARRQSVTKNSVGFPGSESGCMHQRTLAKHDKSAPRRAGRPEGSGIA